LLPPVLSIRTVIPGRAIASRHTNARSLPVFSTSSTVNVLWQSLCISRVMPESLTIAPNAEPIRIRVLLIEDDPIAIRLLKADFQAREAADLELIGVQRLSEGLRLLTEERADVVL